ncbi:MAG TPA: GNAT family N-acetyltransferase [Nocardioidaceae bacterium]|nr:GNAT family N-acetyltransferase [Nocardioidaceae bacterium]
MSLTLRDVDAEADADLLHAWVSAERATFWGMTDRTREEVAEIYGWIQDQDHLAAYLVEADGEPVALVQTYDPFVDEIGDYYERAAGDLGLHFFMGPDRASLTPAVAAHMLSAFFERPEVQRIVAEPDARNHRAVRLVQRLGFELGPEVELPHKPAQFAFLTRDVFAISR